MRILHIVPLIGTNAEYGGPARGTMRQADALTENGHTVSVLSLWRGAKPTPEASSRVELVTFAARSVPGLPGFGGLFSFKALRWLRANATKFEIVHIHGGRELWVLLASIILRNLKISYVVQTHGMLNRRDNRKIVWYDRFLTKPAYSHASALLYLTNFEQRRLKEFDWMPKTELLLNGVDAPDIIVPPAIENSELRVVTTARIHPRKHIPDLVDAIAILLDKGVDVSLDIYGPDEGDVDRILKKIEERNLGNAIKYRGALSYTEIRNVLREYNTYVLPSRHEPFPNSLLEALASGLASICTEECGLAPYIVEGKAGLVVEHGPKGISESLLRLSAEPRLRRQLGEAALTLCDSTFSMIAVRERIEEIYSEQIENENKVMRRA